VAPEYRDRALPPAGGDEVVAALDAFGPAGDVLELACGPGTWTALLLRHADTVTAVDGSPEMLAIASSRVHDERVRFVRADLFAWRPDRRFDVVFFGFWISHVPPSGSNRSGRSWPRASGPTAACSSSMTPTATPASSSSASARRWCAGA
jgi:SAM-dependent methyltransferase